MNDLTLATGCRLLLGLVCSLICAVAQPLDWGGDIVVYGTQADEFAPALSVAPVAGVLRAVGVVGDTMVASKLSSDNGQTWSEAAFLPTGIPAPRAMSTAVHDYGFVLIYGDQMTTRTLYRFEPAENDWSRAMQRSIAPDHTGVTEGACVFTDAAFEPDDPFLNVCWIESDSGESPVVAYFAQSRDDGNSFRAETVVYASSEPDTSFSIAGAVSWQGEDERIHIAAAIQRPGSTPSEIRVFRSSDQGATWDGGNAPDIVSYRQSAPSISAFENTVFLAYERPSSGALQRDVYFTYSPDGGSTFAPPTPLGATRLDEEAPQMVVDSASESFLVFYLTGEILEEERTLVVRVGDLRAPWIIGSEIQVSETGGVLTGRGYSADVGPLGSACAWTGRFALGDADVRFDASWRGAAVRETVAPRSFAITLGQSYPNPFNGTTTLALAVTAERRVALTVGNTMGQEVLLIDLGFVSPGVHPLAIDLSAFPSGVYSVREASGRSDAVRLIHVR